MTTKNCKYHPLHLATWHCPCCYIAVCPECVQRSLEPEAVPVCLLCQQALTSLQPATTVIPFWLQYTQFMRLPLSLLGILLLVLFLIIPSVIPQSVHIPMMLVVYAVSGFYGWHLLQQSATGELQTIKINTITQKTNKLTGQVAGLMAALFVGSDVIAAKIPFLGTYGLNLFLVLILPVMLMAIAIHKQMTAAMQWEQLKQILLSLRFFYAPVVLAALLLVSTSSSMILLLKDVLSVSMTQGLEQALYSYTLWVMMSIVGFVLFEFHQLVDFDVAGKKNKKRSVAKQQDIQQIRLAVYLKEGLYDKAAALLKEQSNKFKTNPEIQETYYKLLIFMQDAEQVSMQASHYIEALLASGQHAKTLEVLQKIKRLVPDFVPSSPEMRFELAKICVDYQQYDLVSELLRHLHKEYPHYAHLPEAYLLLAKVLHERLNASTEALEVMEYLALRFQKHPRYALIDKFWRMLGGKPKEDFVL